MNQQYTQLTDLISGAVAKAIAPLNQRLTRVETRLDDLISSKRTRRDATWKLVTLILAAPAGIYAVSQIVIGF